MSEKSPYPIFGLAGLASLVRIQVVQAQPSVRVEDEKRFVLVAEVFKDLNQYCMLEDLSSIPPAW